MFVKSGGGMEIKQECNIARISSFVKLLMKTME